MRRRLACLLAAVAWATLAAAGVEQSTVGWCSPAINGRDNQVECAGDPRVMARIDKLFDLVGLVVELFFRREGEDPALEQTVEDLVHQGNLPALRALDVSRMPADRILAAPSTPTLSGTTPVLLGTPTGTDPLKTISALSALTLPEMPAGGNPAASSTPAPSSTTPVLLGTPTSTDLLKTISALSTSALSDTPPPVPNR